MGFFRPAPPPFEIEEWRRTKEIVDIFMKEEF